MLGTLGACIVSLVSAQSVPTHLFEGKSVDAVRNALYEACYEAGMTTETGAGAMLECSSSLEGDERSLADIAIADVHEGRVVHRIRFALAERAEGVRAWAYPRIEILEPDGVVLEAEIASPAYLERVATVLERTDASLEADSSGGGAQPWRNHYDTRRAWTLEAHLRAVEHCDRNLDDLTPGVLERLVEQAGVQPRGETQRDRCEELYTPVYEWGLARGVETPTVEGYAEYRESLPPAQRCEGLLALGAECD